MGRRPWHGKSAYNTEALFKVRHLPDVLQLREVVQDGKTPAMRFRLAKGPIASEDIVYSTPNPSAAARSSVLAVAPQARTVRCRRANLYCERCGQTRRLPAQDNKMEQ